MATLYDPGGEHADYVELPEAARRMGISVARVLELCRHRVLKSVNLGMGIVLVRPEINNLIT